MFEADEDGVYLRIWPSAGRRLLALASYFVLGGLLIWVGFALGGSIIVKLLLLLVGFSILLAGERMRRATLNGVELTVDGLRETSGVEIARWENVVRVERGVFAVKPTNGFSVTLKDKAPRRWVPGLWWRSRRRVGVGGVLRSREARSMGEQMATLLGKHDNSA